MTPSLTLRLRLAASLVETPIDDAPLRPAGSVILADVGCDHAYLAMDLLLRGVASFAVCSDLRQGPLTSAAENLAAAGLTQRTVTLLTDGLDGVAPYHPTDVVICGMGGETICHILQKAPFLKTEGLRLVLQPMTDADTVCFWLWNNGFEIVRERYALEGVKPYRLLLAVYRGICADGEDTDALCGRLCDPADHKAYAAYLEKQARCLQKQQLGCRDPEGVSQKRLTALLAEITARLDGLNQR